VTAARYLTGCETWLVGNNNMPWGEIFSVPRQNIRGEFGIQAAKVAIFVKTKCFEIIKLIIGNNHEKKSMSGRDLTKRRQMSARYEQLRAEST
jgi:hypothetical protein